MKFVGLLSVILVCASIYIGVTEGRPQDDKKVVAREAPAKPDDLEAGAEEDLKGAESNYLYGYYPGYSYSYPSYYRRYSYYPYGGYGGYGGYYGRSHFNDYYRSLGGFYGGLYL